MYILRYLHNYLQLPFTVHLKRSPPASHLFCVHCQLSWLRTFHSVPWTRYLLNKLCSRQWKWYAVARATRTHKHCAAESSLLHQQCTKQGLTWSRWTEIMNAALFMQHIVWCSTVFCATKQSRRLEYWQTQSAAFVVMTWTPKDMLEGM